LIDQNLKDLTFNIIIDDASHKSEDVIATFELMFYRVRPGGLYIIEDLHTSYWKSHNGGYKASQSQIEYLKNLVDLLNVYHIRKDDEWASDNKEFYNRLPEKDKDLFVWINSITFYDNVAVIEKLKHPRNGSYARKVVGTKQPIIPSIDIAKEHEYYHNPSK